MAELKSNAANTLLNDIVMWLMTKGIDRQEALSELYILMHDYDISERTTDLVVYEGNRNEELLRRFIVAKTTAGCSQKSMRQYYKTIQRILMKIGKDVDQVTTDDIRYYNARHMKQGVAKSTINNERHYLMSFYTWLISEELVSRNPMLRIEPVRQTKKKESAFTEDDLEIMRINLRDWREKAIFEVLLSTCCRVSELVSIKIDDIQEDGAIYIHGKGDKYRYVYLNARARITVQEYLKERKDANPYLFPRATPAFVGPGSHISGRRKIHTWYQSPEFVTVDEASDKSTIEAVVRKLGGRSKITNVHPHRFRRTGATRALRAGMPLELVSKMLGHANVGVTQVYLDLSEDDMKQAHKKYVT